MLAQGWRLRPLPTAGIAIAVAMAAARVGWNLARPEDLFLDSWVLVHVLRIMTEGAEPLPRAALTLHYPLAYLPLYPLAELLGPFETVKLVYPALVSLAAIPAFLLVRRGPMPVAGIVAVLFLPDFLVKTLTGTPQGLALPLFLLALHFALRRHRAGFVTASTAVLFTHHLTGLITLVLYYAVWVLARRREPGFLRGEWPYLLYFGLWPLYWAWTFSNTNQSYMAPMLLVLTAIFGVPLAAVLFVSANRLRGIVYQAGGIVSRMPAAALLAIVGTAAIAGWLLTDVILESPGLSTTALANRTVTGVYAALMVLGGAAALARRHVGLTLFASTLLALGAIVLAFGCQHVFDGLRVADYAVLSGIAALFAPGLRARWMSRRLLLAVAALAVLGGVMRLEPGYDRLFAHTEGQREAARWIDSYIPERASVATDAKMSLLVLGEGGRNATFEGTWWLFDGSPIETYVAELNRNYRFRDRPIHYVLLSDYMLTRGADVTWFSPTLRAGLDLPDRLDGLGQRIYEEGGVTIWELDRDRISGDAPFTDRIDLTQDVVDRLHSGFSASPCR